MSSFTINVSQVKAWSEAVRSSAADVLRKQINLGLKNSANLVQRVEATEMPRDTNNLAGSIRQLVTTLSASIGPTADYAPYVNFGTTPHMPPVDAITPWAEAKGIKPWALAKSIAKKGTKANNFIERTFVSTVDAVEQEFLTVEQIIIDYMASV